MLAVLFSYFMITTKAVAEIPLRFIDPLIDSSSYHDVLIMKY
eukprot:COSAG01_NODE_787_length_13598_cov_17.218535_1_plen_42_part_00